MSDTYKDLDPAELDQLADSLDALVTEFAGRARYLRTLSLRHRVAGRRARAESAIAVAEKVIADGYVGEDTHIGDIGSDGVLTVRPGTGWPYTPVDYPTVYANATSGEVGHYRADGTLSHTTPRKTGEE